MSEHEKLPQCSSLSPTGEVQTTGLVMRHGLHDVVIKQTVGCLKSYMVS